MLLGAVLVQVIEWRHIPLVCTSTRAKCDMLMPSRLLLIDVFFFLLLVGLLPPILSSSASITPPSQTGACVTTEVRLIL